jgi:hypothetical protein
VGIAYEAPISSAKPGGQPLPTRGTPHARTPPLPWRDPPLRQVELGRRAVSFFLDGRALRSLTNRDLGCVQPSNPEILTISLPKP